MNKMYVVDVSPTASWESTPAYVRAGSRVAAIRCYMDVLTGIGDEGDVQDDEIDCVSFPDCPVRSSKLIMDESGCTPQDFPGRELLPLRAGTTHR